MRFPQELFAVLKGSSLPFEGMIVFASAQKKSKSVFLELKGDTAALKKVMIVFDQRRIITNLRTRTRRGELEDKGKSSGALH